MDSMVSLCVVNCVKCNQCLCREGGLVLISRFASKLSTLLSHEVIWAFAISAEFDI